jgi:hypothetical protein
MLRWLVAEDAAVIVADPPHNYELLSPFGVTSGLVVPVRASIIPGDENLRVYDFLSVGFFHPRILSEKALGVLSEFLEGSGEVVELKISSVSSAYYAFFPRKVVDIIDIERSEIKETRHAKFLKKAVFKHEKIYNRGVFLAKGFEVGDIWVTEDFAYAVNSAGLLGAAFVDS